MNPKKINKLGMILDEWKWKSCRAEFGVEKSWATLYYIESRQEGKGHATELLTAAKAYYEKKGKEFGGSVALNERMRKLYQKFGISQIPVDSFSKPPGDGRMAMQTRIMMIRHQPPPTRGCAMKFTRRHD